MKKEDQLVVVGEVDSAATTHKEDSLPMTPTDEKASRKVLEEAQANLNLAVETGYKPELRRNFSPLALLGAGFGLTNSWFGISTSLVAGISSGGPMMIIYGIIIVASVCLCIGATLSELASAMPNAGGQVYWARKLAPDKYAPFASYLTGLFAVAGYIFTSVSVTITIASILVGMYVFNSGDPNMEAKRWQIFVAYEIVNLALIPVNVWEKPLARLSQSFLWVSLLGFFVSIVVVLAVSLPNYNSAHFVFVEFENGTGWSSAGIAFIVGLINPTWAFNGMDGATHLAEESLKPRTDIPKAIMGTVITGLVTSLTFSISMFFCIKNLDAILASGTGLPIIDIYYQALNSRAGSLVLTVLLLLTAFGCNIATHTCQARLCWSFSRDHGLPGSRYWSVINTKTGTPLNAHLMCCAWCAVIGCIYLVSSTAYNSMMVGCVTFLLLSYSVPVIFLLKRGRESIEYGPFKLGRFGYFCNSVLLAWVVFAMVFFSFPSVMPVTKDNMNYISVIFVGFGIYCWAYWVFRGKKEFKFTTKDDELEALASQLSNKVDHLEAILSI